jgi:small-conductance mechanosensitive channel
VIFEDFGDSALIFNLYFWLNLTADTNTLQVMSELRFLIDEALADAGIVIAFPQQDIHLDTAQPLKIEMITPESGRA